MTSAYAIFFVAPLLGEHVGPRRWAAIAVGLVGVLVVLRPTGEGLFGWAGLAVVVAPFEYSALAWGLGLYMVHRERVHGRRRAA